MDELRTEIRAAFENEQSAHPPAPDLRQSVVASVTTHPRHIPTLQWAAVAAAALIGLAVVAGLMSSRLAAHHTLVPGSTPKATPVTDYGPPPVGVPLLYVHDPNNPAWLIGYDWSGTPRGTVKLSPDLAQDPSAIQMSPDGSWFEVGGTYKGGSGVFVDRLGHAIPHPFSSGEIAGAMWANDNPHQCLLTFDRQTLVWGLSTVLPGQPVRPVGVITSDRSIGQTGISLAACSYQSDRAIVIRTVIASISDVWMLRISDGEVLSHRSFVAGTVASIVASPDAAFLALMPDVGADHAPGTAATRILRVSDWSVVATLSRSTDVLGFSGDGSLLLASSPGGNTPLQFHLATIDWRSGRTVWSYDGAMVVSSLVAQLAGRDIAVALEEAPFPRPCCIPEDPSKIIEIVHGDGSSTVLAHRYVPLW